MKRQWVVVGGSCWHKKSLGSRLEQNRLSVGMYCVVDEEVFSCLSGPGGGGAGFVRAQGEGTQEVLMFRTSPTESSKDMFVVSERERSL